MLNPTFRMIFSLKKSIIRMLRRFTVKQLTIKLSQKRLLAECYPRNAEKLIIFLTPGYDVVNGGILSISSIYGETVKLKHIHGAEVIMCTIPGHPLLLRYTQFKNQNYMYGFSQVLSYFQNLHSLMIHIPECRIDQFLRGISDKDHSKIIRIENVDINIMIQNIEALCSMRDIDELRKLGRLTCTTAHEQYATSQMRERLGFPLHKLSVWASPEQYNRVEYGQKEELMIVSPDAHPQKPEVLSLISRQFPRLRIKIIKNLTYEKYRDVISQAKWALTFGEGLDGYFIETIFSGGVSFSSFNSMFFTEDFNSLRTVYDSYDIMLEKICSDISALDNETDYTGYQNKQHEMCSKYYSYEQYIRNLELFYKGEYTYV